MKKYSKGKTCFIGCAKLLLFMMAVSLLLCPIIASAQAPALPCRFHGTVQLDNATVPDGTVITAIIGEDTYYTLTPSVYGNSTYLIQIEPPGNVTYTDGTPVIFLIGNCSAVETGTWQTGLNLVLNLTASTPPPPTPTPTPMPTLTATPTPFPTPTVTVAPPTPTPTPKAGLSVWRIAGGVVLCILALLFLGVLAFFARMWMTEKKGTETEQGQPAESGSTQKAEEPEIKMSLKDKMLMKMMSNKWVIKFMSIPIVMKIITAQMKAMMWVQSLFSRRSARKK
jgi:hypothetical protein